MVWLVLFLATDHQPGQGSGTAQSQHGQQNQRERIGGLRDNSSRCRGCCRCLGGSGRCRGRSSAGRIAAVGGSITRGRSSRRRGGRGGRLRGLRLFARLGLLLELPKGDREETVTTSLPSFSAGVSSSTSPLSFIWLTMKSYCAAVSAVIPFGKVKLISRPFFGKWDKMRVIKYKKSKI